MRAWYGGTTDALKREKVTVDRLRVGDLVDLAENGQFEALMAPELDALKRVWPDHTVIRAAFDERQNSPVATGCKPSWRRLL